MKSMRTLRGNLRMTRFDIRDKIIELAERDNWNKANIEKAKLLWKEFYRLVDIEVYHEKENEE